MSEEATTVAVLGAGTMGRGIAQVAAQNGHPVLLIDSFADAVDEAQQALNKLFDTLVAKEKFTRETADAVLERISFQRDHENLDRCGLVIEAIIEEEKAKTSAYQEMQVLLDDDAIIATNTSSLPITGLAAALKRPERFVGMHFFNPAPLMPLVEIVPGLRTDKAVVEGARNLADSWGKTTVVAKDTPGFIVNRVARPFYSEPLKMLEEGLADTATIDWAMREIGGFRMGPFQLMDLIGNDVNYTVTETVWKQFYYDPRFKPSITQQRMKQGGLYGRKSGQGFYDYSEDAQQPEADKDEILGRMIVDRTLALLINEATDALFLNIATAEDIDLAMTQGVNYPRGLLEWGDKIGPANVLARLENLQKEYGDDRYRPNPLLRKLVAENRPFRS